MSLGLPFTQCFGIVDDCYKPVPVVSNVEDHVAIDKVGILEHAANFTKIVPWGHLDNGGPCHYFVRRIRVAFHRLLQMLTRNDPGSEPNEA